MPGFITHYICGEAMLNGLPAGAQNLIQHHRQLYNVGCQGPDIFFYYLPGLIKKNMKNLGIDMHKTQVGSFISHVLDGLAEADEEAQPIIFSYLSGYLSHYSLDCFTHPYVYYKSGFQIKGDRKSRLRYSVYHRNFETAIDVLMLKVMSSEKPSEKKLWQLIKTDADQARLIARMVSAAITGAYQRDVSPKEVYSAMRYMVNVTRILQSKKGRRKRLMELAEELTVGDHLVSCIIHQQEVKDGIDYLNIHKKPWYMPWDNENENETTASFGELYNQAVENGISLIGQMYAFMQGELSKESLVQAIGNRSLASGLEIDEDREFTVHGNVFA
ncbi:MAG: zinc dependent phospholipase C family protein [Clostridiales bacterium]|jgi:hypothetical protein|nr:zinc dependent phospholipase C family protein [Clostridiales bacterium]